VDASLLGASGHSCGGLQTIEMRSDPRVKVLAPLGYATRESVWAKEIIAPVGFFVGSQDTSIALPRGSHWICCPALFPVPSFPAQSNTKDTLADIPNAQIEIQGAWPNLPATTPAWWGTFPNLGHGGTFYDANGGKWAVTFAKWVLFTLKGDPAAADYFKGNGATADGWQVKTQALDRIAVVAAKA
jgi:hypothetical protein